MSSTDHNPPLQKPQNVSVPEMGRFQRQIVDSSLEEGQFQSGIDALDQLRSPDHKPSVYATLSHIFSLIADRYKQYSYFASYLHIIASSTRNLSER